MNETLKQILIYFLSEIPHWYRLKRVLPYLMSIPPNTTVRFFQQQNKTYVGPPTNYWWIEYTDPMPAHTRRDSYSVIARAGIKDLYASNLWRGGESIF